MSAKPTSKPDRMEKLAISLSLPRQNTYNAIPEVERPAGLPINALPGWESIPLHSKLPMLKCPDNQVIFSKNKIGRCSQFESWQRDFDSVCRNAKNDYNPLHDPHLRRFYSNEKLLKRLRENGEITQNNDVICTLKEFNEHRIPLHETYLSLIRIERKRLDDEKYDNQMIDHAESIAQRDIRLYDKRMKETRLLGDIKERKAELIKRYSQKIQALRAKGQRKAQQIESLKAARLIIQRQRKDLHDFRIKQRLDVSLDIRRKRLIALKKHLQFKSDRLKTNLKLLQEKERTEAKDRARLSWEKHLKERIIKHAHLKQITKENENEMREWIQNHMEEYHKKWKAIQTQLENSSKRQMKKSRRRKLLFAKLRNSLQASEEDYLRNLTSQDIRDALHTAIDIEDTTYNAQESHVGDSIYKAAKYILEGILAKFSKDLSGDKYVEDALAERVNRLFCEVKMFVTKRACHVIASGANTSNMNQGSGDQKRGSVGMVSTRTKRCSLLRFVSFNSLSALIGKSSYGIEDGDLKETSGRQPTPTGSLTSVVIDDEDDAEGAGHHHLARDEQIFIEHLFIKFKRQLLVGIGRQVLSAIECHRNNKILDIRRELLEIDKKFLVKIMTRSILSYAINECNYYSNALLCQHVLAGEIIKTLQEGPLKPARDPRCITQPRSRCECRVAPPFTTYGR